MWYNTKYFGEVIFSPQPTARQLAVIKDAIENAHEESSYALDLSKDFSSIEWAWNEKTYDFEEALNAVQKYIKDKWLDIDFVWEFEYQWEESDDRWYVRKIDWLFVRMEADEYKCPHCWHIFKPNN